MKTNKIAALLLLISVFSFFACKDKILETRTFTANKPIYLSYNELRSAVKSTSGKELKQTGKIYFYDRYIFVNEYLKGIHIIDNSDPSNPQNIKFIEIPGNIDMVIKNNFLYVDSYVDLVVLNIADINNIAEVYRVENVFPYQVPSYDYSYPLAHIDKNAGVVTGFSVEEVSETYQTSGHHNMDFGLYKDYGEISPLNGESYVNSGAGHSQGIGIAGSTARFAIYNNNMYLLNKTTLNVYDISNPKIPEFDTKIDINATAETLFAYEGNLFTGTQTGMKIYSLTNPASPVFVSEFNHIQSCDPVVVKDDYAYVTLRTGNNCGGSVNRLDIVDLKTITSPQLVKSYSMTNPHGLGINNENTLFVCDGEDGLKVYDASDPLRIDENMLYHFPSINAFDIIPLENIVITIAQDGLYQYKFENGEMTFLSHISIGE